MDVPFELYRERHERPELLPEGFFVALAGENDQLGFVRHPAWVHYSKSIQV